MLTLETQVQRDSAHVSAMTGEREVAVMSVAAGAYYGLNEVATRIWQLAENPIAIASICAALQSEYEIDGERCEREVLACVRQMMDEGLIRVVDA